MSNINVNNSINSLLQTDFSKMSGSCTDVTTAYLNQLSSMGNSLLTSSDYAFSIKDSKNGGGTVTLDDYLKNNTEASKYMSSASGQGGYQINEQALTSCFSNCCDFTSLISNSTYGDYSSLMNSTATFDYSNYLSTGNTGSKMATANTNNTGVIGTEEYKSLLQNASKTTDFSKMFGMENVNYNSMVSQASNATNANYEELVKQATNGQVPNFGTPSGNNPFMDMIANQKPVNTGAMNAQTSAYNDMVRQAQAGIANNDYANLVGNANPQQTMANANAKNPFMQMIAGSNGGAPIAGMPEVDYQGLVQQAGLGENSVYAEALANANDMNANGAYRNLYANAHSDAYVGMTSDYNRFLTSAMTSMGIDENEAKNIVSYYSSSFASYANGMTGYSNNFASSNSIGRQTFTNEPELVYTSGIPGFDAGETVKK